MKKPTMQQIADELDISKNSVSLALSGKPGVSEELRKKVEDTAEKIGYKGTRSRRSSKGRMIGLIVREDVFFDHAFFGTISLNIEQEIKGRGGHLLIHSVDNESERNLLLPNFITENKVDSLLILSHLNLDYLKRLVSLNLPVLLIDHHHPELDVDSVLTDNRKGAYRAVKHILSTGIKDIGFIGPVGRSPSYQERYEGYVQALKEHHLEVNPVWVADNLQENMEELGQYLEGLNTLPECWFSVNDEYGFLVSRILTGKGYSIPEQCSIFGFDNSYFAELAVPPLTTMAVNTKYFAKKSVDQLYKRMKDRKSPYVKVLLDTSLVERKSLKLKKQSVPQSTTKS